MTRNAPVGQNKSGVVMKQCEIHIEGLAIKNGEGRRVALYGKHRQLVVMAPKPKEGFGWGFLLSHA
jgi:hypothetical protein